MNNITCNHESSTAARLTGDTIASVWECEACGHHRPFTSEDFAFHATPWMPPAVPGRPFAGYEARRAYLLG